MYVILLVITIITIYPLFGTGLATADDTFSYIIARSGQYMSDAAYNAQLAGRFYYYIVKPVNCLPYFYDNWFVIKLFQIIPLVLCFILFAMILWILTKSKEIAILYFLLFLTISQVSNLFNLFVTYPFYYTFSFGLLLGSFLLLLKFYDSGKKMFLIYSVLLYTIGLLFYETYLLYLFIVVMTILGKNAKSLEKSGKIMKKSTIHFLPFFCVGLVYMAVYFIFRYHHPSVYPGSSFSSSSFSLGSFFKVLWNLSYTSFPLTVFESNRILFEDKSEWITGYHPIVSYIIFNAKVEWIIKGILIAVCGYELLYHLPDFKFRTYLTGALLSIFLIFIPHVPLALTGKYTFYAIHGGVGYVTTFFSLFGTVLLITMILGFIMKICKLNQILKGGGIMVLVVLMFTCSVLTDFSNYTLAKDIRSANIRFFAIDELTKTPEYSAIPQLSVIYAPDLYNNPSSAAAGVTEQGFDWSWYLSSKSGGYQQIIRDQKEYFKAAAKTPGSPYYITIKQAVKTDDLLVVLSKMDPVKPTDSIFNPVSNQAFILYYSPYKIFSFSFRCRDASIVNPNTIKIGCNNNEFSAGKEIEFTVYNTRKNRPVTIFTIEGQSIDLKSITVSNMVNPESRVIYL